MSFQICDLGKICCRAENSCKFSLIQYEFNRAISHRIVEANNRGTYIHGCELCDVPLFSILRPNSCKPHWFAPFFSLYWGTQIQIPHALRQCLNFSMDLLVSLPPVRTKAIWLLKSCPQERLVSVLLNTRFEQLQNCVLFVLKFRNAIQVFIMFCLKLVMNQLS